MLQEYRELQYSPIRIKFSRTGEIFNIGVIVMDEFRANREIRIIDSFDDIAKCLRIDEPKSHEFVLNTLKSSFNRDSFVFGEKFSNSMIVESPEWLNSYKDISSAADDLFDELVTIKRAVHDGRHIDMHTPTKIVTSLKEMAGVKEYRHIEFRKRFAQAYNKQIDAVVYVDDEEKEAAIGVEVCTPASDGFTEKGAFSMIALLKAMELNSIKKPVMYMPALGYKKASDRRDFLDLRSDIEKHGVTVIKTEDYNKFYSDLNNMAVGFGTRLF